MQVQPYLFFEGKCEEAVEFYREAVGAEILMMMRNKENPDPSFNPPNSDNKILHGAIKIGESTVNVSDGFCSGKPHFQGFSLSVTVANEAEAERTFKALADGGAVKLPLSKTFFSASFGMLTDRFGVGWMVYMA